MVYPSSSGVAFSIFGGAEAATAFTRPVPRAAFGIGRVAPAHDVGTGIVRGISAIKAFTASEKASDLVARDEAHR